jgi:hypothetical protein
VNTGINIASTLGAMNAAERRATQERRNAAVAAAFDDSWTLIRQSRGWWPSRRETELRRLAREAGGVSAAVESPGFVDLLGASLRAWRAFRNARYDRDRLAGALHNVAPQLPRWEGVTVLTLPPGDVPGLFELFDAVRDVKPSQRRWVVTSKLLYHLLPDLIPPMDNMLTAPFLGRSSLPPDFGVEFVVESMSAFVDLARNRRYGIGARRLRAAAKEVPFPIEEAASTDSHIGPARALDFAVAGFVLRDGDEALRRS